MYPTTNRLLIATNNPGKLREYQALLEGGPFHLTTPSQVGLTLKVEEIGDTYKENALLKAKAFARASGLLTLADDSGVEVDALGGRPGPLAARYGGPGLTDEGRVNYLLQQLQGVPLEKRTACFRCIIAIAGPFSAFLAGTVEGECRGLIALEPRGQNGFGYDPIFYLPELGRTLAELPLDEKNQVSHRGKAARAALRLLTEGLVIRPKGS